jgi:hypothetical protein
MRRLRRRREAHALGDEQEHWSRLLLRDETSVPPCSIEAPLAIELDDEERPAGHGSALAADRRRAWNSIANVALLGLPHCESTVLKLPPIGSSHV